MGRGSFTSDDWSSYKKEKRIDYAYKASDIYKTGISSVKNLWLPYNVIRESCDSAEHPDSTPTIIGLDVTGSMSRILTEVAKKLGFTMKEIIERKIISDPQILFAAIDDYITSHEKCLQVTQFESDIRIAKQMNKLSFIQKGGINDWESYADLWYFAKYHTKCDAIRKGRKGIIITTGDDGVQPVILKDEIQTVFGDSIQANIRTKDLLTQVCRDWDVFHISLAEGGSYTDKIKDTWDEYLGQRHVVLEDAGKLCEIIISLIQSLRGDSVEEIADSWDHSTALVVRNTLGGLSVNKPTGSKAVIF